MNQDGRPEGDAASNPGGARRTDGSRYPVDGDDLRAGSAGDQVGSEGTQSPTHNTPANVDEPRPPDFFESMARVAAQKERDERRRAPGTWMPVAEDLDRDPEPGDETDFGTDGPPRDYTSRQIGLRLRPQHFELLREAAALYGVRPTTMARMMIVRGIKAIHEAELRARARELTEPVD